MRAREFTAESNNLYHTTTRQGFRGMLQTGYILPSSPEIQHGWGFGATGVEDGIISMTRDPRYWVFDITDTQIILDSEALRRHHKVTPYGSEGEFEERVTKPIPFTSVYVKKVIFTDERPGPSNLKKLKELGIPYVTKYPMDPIAQYKMYKENFTDSSNRVDFVPPSKPRNFVAKNSKNEGNQSVAEGSPNFNREWDEATRYPEFVNLGKEKWIELVSKGKQVTVTRKNVNKINNTDAADPKSFKLLDPEKQKRALAQLANGDVEMPIVARYSDGYLELIGGNTRLTAQMAKDGQAKVWLFNVPEELTQGVSENFADGRNPQDKGDSRRHGIPKHASLSQLDKIRSSKTASTRKKQLAHWQANMRRGRMKEATDIQLLAKHYFPVDDEHIIVKYKMKQDSKGYYLPQWNTSGKVFDANYSSLNRLYGRPHTVKAKEFINEFQRSPGHRGNDNDGIISWKAAKAAFKQLADDSDAVDFEERDGGNTVSTTWGPELGAPYARYIMFVHPHGDGQIRGMLLGLYEDGELDEIQKFVLPCSMNGVDHAHRIYMQVRS